MTDSRSVVRRWFLAAGVLLAVAGSAMCDEPKPVTITPTAARGNVFGDEESEFRFKVEAGRAIKGRLVWRVAAGTATVKAGEAELNGNADAPAEVSLKITLPPVKDGVILQTKLTVSVFEADKKQPGATFERDVWIFPHDPFADRVEWLKKLKITLFDPKGDTAKVFTAAKIPCEETKSVDALAEVKDGVVIVGEGTSFKDEKGLAATLQKLAGASVVVLVLAPVGGDVLIPGLGNGAGGFETLTFRREIVRKLDKRLDPDGKSVASTVTVKMGEETVGGEVVPGPGGWPWIEARHATNKGRWAFCGYAVVAKWDAGPTPRFLFAKMLEHLTESE